MIDVTNGADVAMRLITVEFLFSHLTLPVGSLRAVKVLRVNDQAYFA
jgi:hypothetical protein